VPREGYPVLQDGREVGYVTSGTMSPSLRQGIALALVDRAAASGSVFEIAIRRRSVVAEKVKLPFV
jgi:aminomethyltransferase